MVNLVVGEISVLLGTWISVVSCQVSLGGWLLVKAACCAPGFFL